MQRRVTVLVVCLLVVTAGCAGGPGGTEPSEELPFAPGYSTEGIDTQRAAETHTDALRQSTYVLTATVMSGDQQIAYTQRRGETGAIANLTVESTTFEVWKTENRTAFRQNGDTVGAAVGDPDGVRRAVGPGAASVFEQTLPLTVFETGSYSYAGTVRKDGTRFHEYVLDNASTDRSGLTDGRVLVDASGRVRSVNLTGDNQDRITMELRLATPSVERPSWVDDAPSASVTVSEGVVAITNTGTEPITGTVIPFGGDFTGFDEPLAPGETVYVVPDAESVNLTRERPDPVALDQWPSERFAIQIAGETNLIVGVDLTDDNESRVTRPGQSPPPN